MSRKSKREIEQAIQEVKEQVKISRVEVTSEVIGVGEEVNHAGEKLSVDSPVVECYVEEGQL